MSEDFLNRRKTANDLLAQSFKTDLFTIPYEKDDCGKARRRLIKLYIEDKGICWLCDQHVDFEDASRDHVIPRSKIKVTLSFNNPLRLAHKTCNNLRSSNIPQTPNSINYYLAVLEVYQQCRREYFESGIVYNVEEEERYELEYQKELGL